MVSYTPDAASSSIYNGASGTASVTVTTPAKMTPTVTVTPPSSSITTGQALTVTVSVSGGSGNPVPTGTVALTSGSYNSAASTLSAGSATINIPAGSLALGTDMLTVSYTPDSATSSTYNTGSGAASVTVTTPAKITPTMTVTPPSFSITTGEAFSVTVAVSGGSGNPAPTGSVTLSSGNYASAATTLVNGSATINIAAGALATGIDTLTASYAGDGNYRSATGSASVTVAQSTFSLTATTPGNVNRGNSATSTVSVSSITNYSGAVTLTCTLNSGPTNAAGDAPTCTAQTATVSAGGTGTVTVATKPTVTAALERPLLPGHGRGLLNTGSVLALLVLLGVPTRRRNWRAMLGVLALAIALGSLAACGGGGSSKGGGGGGTSDPGTTSGTYTFKSRGPAMTRQKQQRQLHLH